MSYPVVVVIIIITAVVSYLIGMFDAKATNKLISAAKKKEGNTPTEPITDLDFQNIAQIQVNNNNELLVEYDGELLRSDHLVDDLNKKKLDGLISALGALKLGAAVAPKSFRQEQTEPKPKLAMQRSLISTATKKKPSAPAKVMDLVSMVNEKLSVECEGSGMVLDIRENIDHEVSFWVNDRSFKSLDDVEPANAKALFTRVLDEMKSDDH